jgi:isopenicillin-N epimerase
VSKLDPPEPIPGARLLFSLDPAVAHLNHGAFGAVPIGVQRAQQRLRDELHANPMRFFATGLDERIEHVRRHLAAFLGADPDGSALVDNATTGVAIALNSLDLAPGDEIVTTDHGYGAVDLAIGEVCRRTGAVHRVARLPLSPDDATVADAVRGACSSRTRLVIVDAIASATACPLPVPRVVAIAHDAGAAVLVDAAHAPGILATPVAELGAEFWVGNLHKWGYAPSGTALLAVAPSWRDRVRPLVVSWNHTAGFPRNLEWLGSRDYTAWLSAPTGLFTLRTLGVERVRAHNAALAAYGQRVVADALGAGGAQFGGARFGGAREHSGLPVNPGLPMQVVPLPPGVAADLDSARALYQRIVDELSVEVGLMPWNGRGLLRVSAQVYNRPEEYERLAAGLPDLL